MAARAFALPFVLLVAAALWSACGGDPFGPPSQVAAVSTTSLSGVVGAALADPLIVRVTDVDGRPVPGVAVDFQVTTGGGSVEILPGAGPSSSRGLSLSGSAALVSDSTDANGEVRGRWTLGTIPGDQTATATVLQIGEIAFTATAEVDVPADARILNSSAFIGIAGQEADGPITVLVEDQYGNPVGDVTVNWAAVSGGGSIPPSSTTDGSGIAEGTATLRPEYGLDLFVASVTSLAPDTIGLIAVEGISEPADGQDAGTGLVSHDMRFFGTANVNDLLVFYFRFADNILPASIGDPQPSNGSWASLDFDLDQDTTTGYLPLRRCNDPPLDSLAFGADGFTTLDPRLLSGVPNVPAGAVPVGRADSLAGPDRCNDNFFGAIGSTVPVFRNNTVTLGINLSFFADDGVMDFTSVWVSSASDRLTDVVPDSIPQTWDLSMARTPPSLGVLAADGMRHVRFPDVRFGEVIPLPMRPADFAELLRERRKAPRN